MKKFLLSSFLIVVFMLYSVQQRIEESNSVNNVLPPQSTGNNIQSPTSAITPNANSSTTQTSYKDGTYTGDSVDAYYGNVQVQVIIQGGKIIDVQFIDYPQDRSTSRMINSQAMPYLKTEAIQAQNANVDIVTGATDTSNAFMQSLQSALSKANI